MNIGKRRRIMSLGSAAAAQGQDDEYIRATCGEYLIRHLSKHPALDKEAIAFALWVMGEEMDPMVDGFLQSIPAYMHKLFGDSLSEAQGDCEELAEVLLSILKKSKPRMAKKFRRVFIDLLESRIQALRSMGETSTERNLGHLTDIFSLNEAELKLATFLFIIKTYDEAETYLEDHLKCHKFRSRNCLLNILDLGNSELTAAIERFVQIGVIEYFRDQIELTEWFLNCCQSPEGESFTTKFYRRIPQSDLPLDFHMLGAGKSELVLKLLEKKTSLPAHILLYGPPGTGKTSFAYAIAAKLNAAAYEIIWDDENQSRQRRAALSACLKMTNSGSGAIIIVDEADNMLNTIGSWFRHGETQDKGWLNRIMEEPGTRVIWITNSIEAVEESVLRRFAFSLDFRPFNRRQRIQLWKNVLDKNNAAEMLDTSQIDRLARKYKASAGVIDISVKSILAAVGRDKEEFARKLELSLEAHQTLKDHETSARAGEVLEEQYSLEGLNMETDVQELISNLELFDRSLRSDPTKRVNMNLLFYGPPGTGKSALARHIADRLDREIICKRMSDLQSMWVGEGEKNIRRAFEEAENEEAVLVIDEADSFLFDRDRARHSWEISFTNEFLTRMEHFRGILICTTNRMDDLDQACLRRFKCKTRFGYLTSLGVLIFYEKLLAHLVASPLGTGDKADLARLTNLAPGDFKNVRDRFAFQPVAEFHHTLLVQALAEESRVKNVRTGKRSIGF